MFDVKAVENPYELNLAGFNGLEDSDVTQLTFALEAGGIEADCDGLILYPKKNPTTKTKAFILFFIMGALQESIESYDTFKALLAPNTKSRKAKAEDNAETEENSDSAVDVPVADDADLFDDDDALTDPMPTATPAVETAKPAAKKGAARKRTAATKA